MQKKKNGHFHGLKATKGDPRNNFGTLGCIPVGNWLIGNIICIAGMSIQAPKFTLPGVLQKNTNNRHPIDLYP